MKSSKNTANIVRMHKAIKAVKRLSTEHARVQIRYVNAWDAMTEGERADYSKHFEDLGDDPFESFGNFMA